MAIMPATLKQGQKLLAEVTETTRGHSDPSTLRLDYAIARIALEVGRLYSESALESESPDEAYEALTGSVALAMDLSGTKLEKLQATSSRDKHHALEGLHSLTSELLFFYGSNTSAFELTLQRIWAYLIQHSPVIAGAPLAQIVGQEK